jgi:hypothetical protein
MKELLVHRDQVRGTSLEERGNPDSYREKEERSFSAEGLGTRYEFRGKRKSRLPR